MKLELKLQNDWLEATWYTEADEVKTQVHCESFSGHREHIEMLRAKALEFGTELDEALISECIANFKYPTEEELAQQELEAKIAGAKAYLAATDYVTSKYNDMVTVTGSMTKAAFLAQYADVYAQRAEARAVINMGEA